jgi:hypothetical protein
MLFAVLDLEGDVETGRMRILLVDPHFDEDLIEPAQSAVYLLKVLLDATDLGVFEMTTRRRDTQLHQVLLVRGCRKPS